MPPFPARGSGFHRFVFLLFKQDKPIDFSGDTRPSPWYSTPQYIPTAAPGLRPASQEWSGLPSPVLSLNPGLEMGRP